MSRIESGKIHLEETEVSLSEVLHDLKTIISGQIHAKQLELYMDAMDVTNEDVYCDKTALNQVLLNLLSNAVKFTPAGGTVSVRLRQFRETKKGSELYEFREGITESEMESGNSYRRSFLLLSGSGLPLSAGLRDRTWNGHYQEHRGYDGRYH